jgi:hypothetical protein
MSSELTPREPESIDDDGFHGSLNSGRRSNNYLKWTAAGHWVDRDGITPPSPLLVFAVDEALRMWNANRATFIREKPLPDLEQLNAAIPQSEWERGTDGQLRKPWEHIVIVRLVNFASGEIYKYEAATTGAHIAYDVLKEQVITMRALRGTRAMPVVNLDERPMKTAHGMGRRPHFVIIGWKTPGGDAQAVPAKPATPQLSGPTVAPQVPPSVPMKAAPPSAPTTTSPPSAPSHSSSVTQSHQAKPKPPVKLASQTLAAMGDVKPVTSEEILDDEIPW